jgi:Peptidase family M28
MFEAINTPISPNWKLRFAALTVAFVLLAGLAWVLRITQMPVKSYTGPIVPLSPSEADLAKRLSTHVLYLSQTIGERNLSRSGTLQASTAYLRTTLQQVGYQVTQQTYLVHGQTVSNLEVILPGNTSSEAVVVGAHYDSVVGTVGANDNATGVAALLELARLLHEVKTRKTIRLVFFVNEEPPYFQTDDMGSVVYAKQLRRDHASILAMISLETIGYYSDIPGSQKYPPILSLSIRAVAISSALSATPNPAT